MRQESTIMITYDLVKHTEIDLGLANIRELYASGVTDEHFFIWVPSRFVMTCIINKDDANAIQIAIMTTIKALYRKTPESQVKNLQVWVNGVETSNIPELSGPKNNHI